MTVHVVPVQSSDEVMHTLGAGECWCQPIAEDGLIFHRRYIDGPVRDQDDGEGWYVLSVGDKPLKPKLALVN